MSRTKLKRRGLNAPERGQTLVLFVFALAALMGLVALTVDAGLAYVARRDMQNAVDSAVLAGAARLAEGASPSQAAAIVRLGESGVNAGRADGSLRG
jgi:Flp pilus assembly protein TadG